MVFRFCVIRKNSTFALLLITFANGIYLIKKIVLDMKNKSLAFLYPVLIVAVMLLGHAPTRRIIPLRHQLQYRLLQLAELIVVLVASM